MTHNGARNRALSLLVLSYVLLVGIVAVGGWWISNELDRADLDRCRIMAAELALYAISLPAPASPAEQAAYRHIEDVVRAACPYSDQELYGAG